MIPLLLLNSLTYRSQVLYPPYLAHHSPWERLLAEDLDRPFPTCRNEAIALMTFKKLWVKKELRMLKRLRKKSHESVMLAPAISRCRLISLLVIRCSL